MSKADFSLSNMNYSVSRGMGRKSSDMLGISRSITSGKRNDMSVVDTYISSRLADDNRVLRVADRNMLDEKMQLDMISNSLSRMKSTVSDMHDIAAMAQGKSARRIESLSRLMKDSTKLYNSHLGTKYGEKFLLGALDHESQLRTGTSRDNALDVKVSALTPIIDEDKIKDYFEVARAAVPANQQPSIPSIVESVSPDAAPQLDVSVINPSEIQSPVAEVAEEDIESESDVESETEEMHEEEVVAETENEPQSRVLSKAEEKQQEERRYNAVGEEVFSTGAALSINEVNQTSNTKITAYEFGIDNLKKFLNVFRDNSEKTITNNNAKEKVIKEIQQIADDSSVEQVKKLSEILINDYRRTTSKSVNKDIGKLGEDFCMMALSKVINCDDEASSAIATIFMVASNCIDLPNKNVQKLIIALAKDIDGYCGVNIKQQNNRILSFCGIKRIDKNHQIAKNLSAALAEETIKKQINQSELSKEQWCGGLQPHFDLKDSNKETFYRVIDNVIDYSIHAIGGGKPEDYNPAEPFGDVSSSSSSSVDSSLVAETKEPDDVVLPKVTVEEFGIDKLLDVIKAIVSIPEDIVVQRNVNGTPVASVDAVKDHAANKLLNLLDGYDNKIHEQVCNNIIIKLSSASFDGTDEVKIKEQVRDLTMQGLVEELGKAIDYNDDLSKVIVGIALNGMAAKLYKSYSESVKTFAKQKVVVPILKFIKDGQTSDSVCLPKEINIQLDKRNNLVKTVISEAERLQNNIKIIKAVPEDIAKIILGTRKRGIKITDAAINSHDSWVIKKNIVKHLIGVAQKAATEKDPVSAASSSSSSSSSSPSSSSSSPPLSAASSSSSSSAPNATPSVQDAESVQQSSATQGINIKEMLYIASIIEGIYTVEQKIANTKGNRNNIIKYLTNKLSALKHSGRLETDYSKEVSDVIIDAFDNQNGSLKDVGLSKSGTTQSLQDKFVLALRELLIIKISKDVSGKNEKSKLFLHTLCAIIFRKIEREDRNILKLTKEDYVKAIVQKFKNYITNPKKYSGIESYMNKLPTIDKDSELVKKFLSSLDIDGIIQRDGYKNINDERKKIERWSEKDKTSIKVTVALYAMVMVIKAEQEVEQEQQQRFAEIFAADTFTVAPEAATDAIEEADVSTKEEMPVVVNDVASASSSSLSSSPSSPASASSSPASSPAPSPSASASSPAPSSSSPAPSSSSPAPSPSPSSPASSSPAPSPSPSSPASSSPAPSPSSSPSSSLSSPSPSSPASSSSSPSSSSPPASLSSPSSPASSPSSPPASLSSPSSPASSPSSLASSPAPSPSSSSSSPVPAPNADDMIKRVTDHMYGNHDQGIGKNIYNTLKVAVGAFGSGGEGSAMNVMHGLQDSIKKLRDNPNASQGDRSPAFNDDDAFNNFKEVIKAGPLAIENMLSASAAIGAAMSSGGLNKALGESQVKLDTPESIERTQEFLCDLGNKIDQMQLKVDSYKKSVESNSNSIANRVGVSEAIVDEYSDTDVIKAAQQLCEIIGQLAASVSVMKINNDVTQKCLDYARNTLVASAA